MKNSRLLGVVRACPHIHSSHSSRFLKNVLLAVCLITPINTVHAVALQFSIVDIGTLGGDTITPMGINNLGQVTGWSTSLSGYSHAFIYHNGVMTDIGTLGGLTSDGRRINDLGQTAGNAQRADGDNHAYKYVDGVMIDLGTLGGTHSEGWGINNAGQVTGTSNNHAFLNDNGSMIDLGTLGGTTSRAWGINNLGQVTGEAKVSSGFNHAFLYADGVMNDLGTLPLANNSYGRDVNDMGEVVGKSNHHAFLYKDGTMNDLGTLGSSESEAWGINNLGHVVGNFGTSNKDAYFYDGAQMYDLNSLIDDPTWDLYAAYDINDTDMIVGIGKKSGIWRGYLLTPSVSAVPIPPALYLFASGLLGLIGIARKKST